MLSCEELCACEILEKFDISQPTLSSDMKKLEDANIIKSRKEGKNVFYIVNNESLKELEKLLGQIFESSPDCICKE
ncbi:transcriptional regulator, ArsR family [Anaerococcus hydrogenalis DSM 7454]|nr:metalloregulator ArsR/SmtB family transcription factor [Anaerococcus hydrogenalis]EEB35823.1 transcriptional regulator, ArsR family [Anaerococcus hydrogenalis DSM 7454]